MPDRDGTILVVDDTEIGRYAKVRALARAGYVVREAATGTEALHLVASAQPSLVLLDVKLPDMTGIEVCARVKQDYPGVVVLQTSATFIDSDARVRGLEGGADAYLTEPVEADELLANVAALLRLKRAETSLRESEEHFQFALEAADMYAWDWDAATGRMHRARNAGRILDLPPETLADESAVEQAMHPEDQLGARLELSDLTADRFEREFRIVRPDGSVRWIAERGRTRREHGRLVGMHGVGLDITAQKLLLLQKDMLLREVDHRVKNSLQMVSSLLNLQARAAPPDVRQHLRDAQQRLVTVARIHGELYKTNQPHTIEFGRFVSSLAHDLTQSVGAAGAWTVDVASEPIQLDIAAAVPLAVIANELIMNAVKHAGESSACRLSVAFARRDGRLVLDVADDGPGLPAAFDPSVQRGLGMQLISVMVQQLGGEFRVAESARGARFMVAVPAPGVCDAA